LSFYTRESLQAALLELSNSRAHNTIEIPGTSTVGDIWLESDDVAMLLEALEPHQGGYEGWADVELMGHRRRIAHVREIELGRRGFLELTWNELGVELREIYSPTAIFCLTPLEDAIAADELRETRRNTIDAF
jgi:hypothetical protein